MEGTMRTVLVEAFGGPEQLAWVERPLPVPGPGEVLLRLHACGLGFSDRLMCRGEYPGGPRPPFAPGVEAAGEIVAVGGGEGAGGAPRLLDGEPARLGQRVLVVGRGGLQATHAAVPAADCMPLPPGLSWVEAAALPVSFLTAWHALVTVGRAAPSEVVLIHGAGGGLGTAAVQIARRLGLRVVATASTAEKRARLAALGAEVTAGYEDFEAAVRAATAGRGPDLVLETVGGRVLTRGLRLLPPLGRLVLVGLSSGEIPAIDAVSLLHRSRAVLGLHLSAILARPELVAASLASLFAWIAAGELRVQVGEVLPLAEIRRAHELLTDRNRWGKIVLVPGEPPPPGPPAAAPSGALL